MKCDPLFGHGEPIEAGWINIYHYEGHKNFCRGAIWEEREDAIEVEDEGIIYRIRIIPKEPRP